MRRATIRRSGSSCRKPRAEAFACSGSHSPLGCAGWAFLRRKDSLLTPLTLGFVSYVVFVAFNNMTHYLGSKFIPELRYHLPYDCTALAELENGRGAAIERSTIRNLRDNNLEPGGLALTRAAASQQAFSKERWEAFRQDVEYFRTLSNVRRSIAT